MFTIMDSLTPEELISCLSYRPENQLKKTIVAQCPPTASTIRCILRTAPSPLTFGKLPPELLDQILSQLDFHSLLELGRVCTWTRAAVESFSAFRDLMEHAPHTLAAFKQSRLLNLHPPVKILAVFRSETCTYCSKYGAFLFLPTCERCCWECMRGNSALRVFPPGVALVFFGLPRATLATLPGLITRRGISIPPSTIRHQKLISVKQARELVRCRGGSAQDLARFSKRRPGGSALKFLALVCCRDGIVDPEVDPDFVEPRTTHPKSLYFGLGATPFPSVSPSGSVEHGLWCKGCRHTFMSLPPHSLFTMAVAPWEAALEMMRRAWSRDGFLDHVKSCPGSLNVLAEQRNEEVR